LIALCHNPHFPCAGKPVNAAYLAAAGFVNGRQEEECENGGNAQAEQSKI